TPGDSDEMISAALESWRDPVKTKLKLSGIILSGGIVPEKEILDFLSQARIPVLLSEEDTYSVSSTIHDLTVKIKPENITKINMAVKLIKDHVDLDKILKGI
ncbi:MAG: DRTGG domain-containing protein, partial [Candidatus Omnitrophica bacterium]|nr:DRTGG domain-containing protein [Candidatus Omnitrophota bacterium]